MKWINWIRRCIPNAKVSVLVNGTMGREFSMERGLRQQFLLSPMLFNLVVEALPTLINLFEDIGWLCGIQIRGPSQKVFCNMLMQSYFCIGMRTSLAGYIRVFLSSRSLMG